MEQGRETALEADTTSQASEIALTHLPRMDIGKIL